MKEQYLTLNNSINLWVETFGNSNYEPVLLISGAGANSSFWSNRLCNELLKKGFYVIRYDHRDFGYSTKIDFEKNPFDVMQLTKDAKEVLDSFKIHRAHVVGHSMGGFIAQLMAICYPERVISISSASSSTSSPKVPLPPEKTWQIFMKNKPTNDFVKDLDGFLNVWKYLNGTVEFDDDLAIDYTRELYSRQEIIGALGASHVKAQVNLTDRSEQLKKLHIPALIIHGEEDYLVDKYGGIQTAECINNSKLVMIPGMGHMLFNPKTIMRFEEEILNFLIQNKSNAVSTKF